MAPDRTRFAFGPFPLDPRELRADAPLLDAYLRVLEAARRPFMIPGHKGRTDLVGAVVAGDVPLYGGLDTMKLAAGTLAEAERRAALLWGADVGRFSVGGSTHGNQAIALAIGRPGDRVVVARTLHRSLLIGLVLAGLEPVWVRPDVDPATGLPLAVPVAAVREALQLAPDAVAVLLGDPSYIGTTGDIAGHAELAHAHGIPLVVDAAWGLHFGFGGVDGSGRPILPDHALALGADALVSSAHKMLPGWSAGALLLARTERIDPARLQRAFEATHTTSPGGAILASIDAVRALLERDGPALLRPLVERVAAARERLGRIPGIRVLDGPGVDPTRLVLVLPETGASGLAVEADLIAAGMPVENADRDTLVPVVTVADGDEELDALCAALDGSIRSHAGVPRSIVPSPAWSVRPRPRISPREAFFADRRVVALASAVGEISAELVAPYPPGIPVLSPGEEITRDVLEALEGARALGARIAYAADPTGRTVEVVAGRLHPAVPDPRESRSPATGAGLRS